MAAKAARKKTVIYEQKALTTKISATSRVAVKIRDNFYTVESHEEREIPQAGDIDLEKEWEFLWEELNTITDNQVQDIVKTFSKNNY